MSSRLKYPNKTMPSGENWTAEFALPSSTVPEDILSLRVTGIGWLNRGLYGNKRAYGRIRMLQTSFRQVIPMKNISLVSAHQGAGENTSTSSGVMPETRL